MRCGDACSSEESGHRECRLGVDDQDEDTGLAQFVEHVHAAGCNVVVVHARKAWLKRLSPKENREVPPLNYERVYRLKREHARGRTTPHPL